MSNDDLTMPGVPHTHRPRESVEVFVELFDATEGWLKELSAKIVAGQGEYNKSYSYPF